MAAAPATSPERGRSGATARDFFLWAGAIAALYGAVGSLVALLFAIVDRAYPDPLAFRYGAEGAFAAMAGVIVLVPTAIVLLHLIRRILRAEPSRVDSWVRRWALVLTVFIAAATALVDLIVILTAFLSGDLSVRFGLKALLLLLIAVTVATHFLVDLRGYWIAYPRRASSVALGALALAVASIVAGFLVIGTPGQARAYRLDAQRVSDLQTLQYQVLDAYQRTGAVPEDVAAVEDPLSGFALPVDPETGSAYRYARTGPLSFELCALFSGPTQALTEASHTRLPHVPVPAEENWQHGEGETCFARTIDPERYPLYER